MSAGSQRTVRFEAVSPLAGRASHPRRKDAVALVLLAVIGIFNVSEVVLGLIKLHQLLPVENLRDVLLVLFVLMGGVAALFCLTRKQLRMDGFGVFLILMAAIGVVVGIARSNELRYVVIDLGRVLFVLSLYLAFRNWQSSRIAVGTLVRSLSAIILWSYFAGIALIYLYTLRSGWEIYVGLGAEPLLLPLSYYYCTRHRAKVFFSILLIVLSGKRGVVFSMVAMLMLLPFLMRTAEKRFRRPLLAIVGVTAALIVVLVGTYATYTYLEGTAWSRAFIRWQRTLPLFPDYNPELVGRGRLDEVLSVFEELREMRYGIYAGGGSGFTYLLYSARFPEIYAHARRTIHFSPAAVLAVSGLPLAMVFFALLAYLLWTIYRNRLRQGEEVPVWWSLFGCALGLLAYTLFAEELFQEPLIWVCLGTLAGWKRQGQPQSTSRGIRYSQVRRFQGRVAV